LRRVRAFDVAGANGRVGEQRVEQCPSSPQASPGHQSENGRDPSAGVDDRTRKVVSYVRSQ